jgi:prefoldin alpha subunit
LTNSFAQLKAAQVKFKSCADNVSEIKPENARLSYPPFVLPSFRPASLTRYPMRSLDPAKPILIPLTSSLYVPGKLTDLENVVIDVGTGYYVSKVYFLYLSRLNLETQLVVPAN